MNYPINVGLYRIVFASGKEYLFSENWPSTEYINDIWNDTPVDIIQINSLHEVPVSDIDEQPELSEYLSEVDMDSNIRNFFNGNARFHAL